MCVNVGHLKVNLQIEYLINTNLNMLETVVLVIWYGYELFLFLCDEHMLKVFEYHALENVHFEEE